MHPAAKPYVKQRLCLGAIKQPRRSPRAAEVFFWEDSGAWYTSEGGLMRCVSPRRTAQHSSSVINSELAPCACFSGLGLAGDVSSQVLIILTVHSSLPHHQLPAGMAPAVSAPYCSRLTRQRCLVAACLLTRVSGLSCCTYHPFIPQAASDFFGDQMKTAANQRARAIAAAEAGADDDAMEAAEADKEANTGQTQGCWGI